MSGQLNAITALIGALAGLIVAIGSLVAVVSRRTKKTNILVNGHLSRLLDILDKADIQVPGGVLKYEPPRPAPSNPDEQNALEYLAQIREDIKNGN